jgi:hypothetical protein
MFNRNNGNNGINRTLPFSLKMPKNVHRKYNANPCEEIWLNGIQVFPIDIREEVGIKGGLNCRIQLNGQYVFIKTDKLDRNAFLNSLTLYESVPEEEGYYTWIVYSIDDGEKKIVLNKVLSYLEIGTKHNILAYRTRATKVHAAGELHIENGVKNINLFSGTFMKNVFESRSIKRQKKNSLNMSSKNGFCDESMLEEFIKEQLKVYFGNDSILRTYEFITKINCPLNKEELDTYTMYGAKVYLFNTKNECNEYYTQSYKMLNGGFRRIKKTMKRLSKYPKHSTHRKCRNHRQLLFTRRY